MRSKSIIRRIARAGTQRLVNRFGYSVVETSQLDGYNPNLSSYDVKPPFTSLEFAGAGLQKLVEDYKFDTVLDIGAGAMQHSIILADLGKKVTAVDYGNSVYFKKFRDEDHNIDILIGDFNSAELPGAYDCIWASHVLEHQINVDGFLKKIHGLLNPGGVLAVTVPPLKHEIVGGHVSLWNAGLVMYRLVLAGFNCSDAAVLRYGYNISVIVTKTDSPNLENLEFDCGDIRKIKAWLPAELSFNSNELDDPFDGNIWRLNW